MTASIVEELLWSPGKTIYLADESERKAAQVLTELIWRIQEPDELFDEMIGGTHTSLLVAVMQDYVERAKGLKPVFISINPSNTEFFSCYEEAMKA